jgi:hypothetical protein
VRRPSRCTLESVTPALLLAQRPLGDGLRPRERFGHKLHPACEPEARRAEQFHDQLVETARELERLLRLGDDRRVVAISAGQDHPHGSGFRVRWMVFRSYR